MSRDRDRFEDLPILTELRDTLEARMTPARRLGRARRHPAIGAWLPMLIAGTVAIAVAVVAVVALRQHPGRVPAGTPGTVAGHGTPRPPHPPSPAQQLIQEQHQRLIDRAQRIVARNDTGCVQRANEGATFLHTAPPQTMLSRFGVLRRPAGPDDAARQTLMSNGFDAGGGVYVDYIREARSEYGKSYFLVPQARITPFSPIPDRCYAAMKAQLRTELTHYSAAQRMTILREQAQDLAIQRQESLHRDGLCFSVVSHHHKPMSGVDGGCSGQLPALDGTLDGFDGEGDRAGGTILSGPVVDGVAEMTLNFPGGAVSSSVVNNVAVFKIPPHRRWNSPSSITYRMTDGRVIERTPPWLRRR